MVDIDVPCPDCSATTTLRVIQSYAPGRLIWSESLRCAACGCALEADGDVIPPTEIRDAIIAAEGFWGLHVDLKGAERLSACKVLHSELNSDFKDVSAMKARIPGIVIAGTRAEMEWLKSQLAQGGLEACVVEADRTTLPPNVDLLQAIVR